MRWILVVSGIVLCFSMAAFVGADSNKEKTIEFLERERKVKIFGAQLLIPLVVELEAQDRTKKELYIREDDRERVDAAMAETLVTIFTWDMFKCVNHMQDAFAYNNDCRNAWFGGARRGTQRWERLRESCDNEMFKRFGYCFSEGWIKLEK